MPYIVQGDSAETRNARYRDLKFDYDYPDGLDLDPNSDFHEELRTKIWQRAIDSRRVMSKRYDSWNEVDKVLTTYIPLSDKEDAVVPIQLYHLGRYDECALSEGDNRTRCLRKWRCGHPLYQ